MFENEKLPMGILQHFGKIVLILPFIFAETKTKNIMRKLILSALMVIGLAFSSEAQTISKNAIGLRIGDNDGFGAEASYQRAVLKNNRLEFDLGVRNSRNLEAVKLAGLFQWVWNIEGGFNWYAGAGAGLGSYRYNYKKNYYNNGNGNNYPYGYYPDDKGTFAFVAGDIGIEYNFDIPLLISLDFRPEIGSNTYYDDAIGADIGIAVRYQF